MTENPSAVANNGPAATFELPPIISADGLTFDGKLREPVVDGLLRRTETLNLIAAPKVGKSFLSVGLALSVCAGRDWLGFRCAQGQVVLVDNELHTETLMYRLGLVASAMDLDGADWKPRLHLLPMRGWPGGIAALEDRWSQIADLRPTLVIVDALYRAIPAGMDENSNSDIRDLYNRVDALAHDTKAAWALVHHLSKGTAANALKSTTDAGAGAGAFSRAADTHLVLRPLKVPGAFGVSAATRSWPAVKPFAVRRLWPVFARDDTLDATDYDGLKRGDKPQAETRDVALSIPALTSAAEPKTRREVVDEIREQFGLSERKAEAAVRKAERTGLVRLCRLPGQPRERRAALFVVPGGA